MGQQSRVIELLLGEWTGRWRRLLAGSLWWLGAAALLVAGCSASLDQAAPPLVASQASGAALAADQEGWEDRLAARWGVKIESLRLSGAGNVLDFRFRVLEPDKAAPLLDREFTASLTDEKRGTVVGVPSSPKVGPLRQTTRGGQPEADRVYFVMFSNPYRLIKAGDPVTVVIGDFRLEHLSVE
ncbi:MAG: hypothetical protein AB1634_05345 [Thermodesulfobacteriota bacterium]